MGHERRFLRYNLMAFSTIDGFVTLKLTGKAVVNHGGAAFYGVAYDIMGEKFDEQKSGLKINYPLVLNEGGTVSKP
jgi:hypothetical protein